MTLPYAVEGQEITEDIWNDVIDALNAVTVPTSMTNPMSATNDIIIGGAAGAPTRLAKGSNGQILNVNGSGNIAWTTPSGGTSQSDALVYHPESYGALANGNYAAGCLSMSASNNVVTASTNIFSSGDVGKVIAVVGAGYGLIQGFGSANQITVNFNASATVSNVSGMWGTDSSAALNSCVAAARATGGIVRLNGVYVAGTQNWSSLKGVIIEGVGRATTTSATVSSFRGSAILCNPGHTGTWIDWSGSFRSQIRNIQFGVSIQGGWATPTVGLLVMGYSGSASENLWVDDCYWSGNYSVATYYSNAIAAGGSFRSQFYNYAGAGAKVLALTSTNYSSITSANGTVNTIGTWQPSGPYTFLDCEMHNQSGATNSNPFLIDGIDRVHIENCLMDSASPHIAFKDYDGATNAYKRTFRPVIKGNTFNPYPFSDNAMTSNTGQASCAIAIDSTGPISLLRLEENRFYVSTAWIMTTSGGGTSASLDRPTIVNNRNVGQATLVVDFVTNAPGTGSTTRISGPGVIECGLTRAGAAMGLSFNGGYDATIWLQSPGSVTVGSGTAAGFNTSSSGFGSMRINGGFNDTSGNQILGFTPLANSNQRIVIRNGINAGTAPRIEITGSGTDANLDVYAYGTGSIITQSTLRPSVAVVLPNNKYIYGEQSTGTQRGLLIMDSSDGVSVGATTNVLNVNGSAVQVVNAAGPKLVVKANNNVLIGSSGQATTSSTGWAFVPAISGAFTGNAGTEAGYAPLMVDITNGRLYTFYTGAAHYWTIDA